jgi:hypothetical protein
LGRERESKKSIRRDREEDANKKLKVSHQNHVKYLGTTEKPSIFFLPALSLSFYHKKRVSRIALGRWAVIKRRGGVRVVAES